MRRRKEKKSKEKKSREGDEVLLSIDEYQKLYPEKDVQRSINKFMGYYENPTHSNAINWLEKEKLNKQSKFRKTKTGLFIAYCSRCGDKHMPNNEYQLKQGSTCCRVEYLPAKIESEE